MKEKKIENRRTATVLGFLACASMVVCITIPTYRQHLTRRLTGLVGQTDHKPGISEVDEVYFITAANHEGLSPSQALEQLSQDFEGCSFGQLRSLIKCYNAFEDKKVPKWESPVEPAPIGLSY